MIEYVKDIKWIKNEEECPWCGEENSVNDIIIKNDSVEVYYFCKNNKCSYFKMFGKFSWFGIEYFGKGYIDCLNEIKKNPRKEQNKTQPEEVTGEDFAEKEIDDKLKEINDMLKKIKEDTNKK